MWIIKAVQPVFQKWHYGLEKFHSPVSSGDRFSVAVGIWRQRGQEAVHRGTLSEWHFISIACIS